MAQPKLAVLIVRDPDGDIGEHDARPDDDPEPGDRCKECGKDITWIGPSTVFDWIHTDNEKNQ